MSLKASILDFLGQPALLPLRERARATHKLLVGTKTRVRLRFAHGYIPGLLSVVVPMYNVENFVADCIESLLTQDYANVEIVVVDDGSPDNSYEVARRYARRDPRVRIVRQPNGGLSSARNFGLRHARGEYLAFLDSDDFVDRHAYREAIEALRKSGSDFSVSPYRREKNGTFPPAARWIQEAHRTTRLGTNLRDFPEIMVNAVAWSKVYRRSFWDDQNLEFPVGLLYEDQALSMHAFAAARSFDVLSRVSINWRIRGDQSSITQNATSSRNIADHRVAVNDSLAALRKLGHADAVDVRVQQILNNNLHEFLPNIRQMDETTWQQFQLFLELLRENASEQVWNSTGARIKVLVSLCLLNERPLALDFLAEGGWESYHFAGTVEGDSLVADFPLSERLLEVLPQSALRFSERETPLVAVARSVAADSDSIVLSLFAYIDHLRMHAEDTTLRAYLVAPDQKRTELAVERKRDAWAAYGHTRRYGDMASGAATVTVPKSQLTSEGKYAVRLEMDCDTLSRSATLTVDGRSTFATPTWLSDTHQVALESDELDTTSLVVRHPEVVLAAAKTARGNVVVEVRSDRNLVDAFLVQRNDRFRLHRSRVALEEIAPHQYRATMTLPSTRTTELGAREHSLHVTEADGKEIEVLFADIDSLPDSATVRVYPYLHGRAQTSGGTNVVDIGSAALVQSVEVRDDSLEIVVNDKHLSSRLKSGRARVSSSRLHVDAENRAQDTSLTLPLKQGSWGLSETAVPSGRCQVLGIDQDKRKLPLYLSSDVVEQLPIDVRHDLVRISIRRSRYGNLHLDFSPPLRDEERGSGDQWRLADQTPALIPDAPRSVLFRNLYGEAANDSALAVHNELVRRGSDLRLLWAVRDRSVRIPEGAEAVLEGSREFYEAFATANYVMVNVHQPHWFKKRDGQILIETFHGYPFKMNGRRWWQRLGFSPERQESFFRRAEEWDYLVSPAPYATPFLREFYREGANPSTEILEIGYPRNDALLNGDAEALRDDTRKRLGIPRGKKAILYAPTFRDYASGDDMTAKLVELFEPRELMRRLGRDYVLLMRGHPFNARSGTKQSRSFINVTDYPDINHLILASDMAILDYSSLRFDYALTGKPTFYFVPDRERYFTGREGFVPYEDTSPGPHVRTLDDLVASITSAKQTAAKFERARKRFVTTYMGLEDGHAAERLVDAVFSPRGDA